MKSNYRKIGDFIELVDERNSDLAVDLLLGLTVNKQFIPSVANTVGTDMSKYKIIRKGQFACSVMQVRRDRKMPVALMTEFDQAIISQAYPVFKVIDEDLLLPEYLMMWFSRPEFDREACFYAVGGVRGSLEWEDFLNMEFPLPSIEKQGEIVREYNAVVNRIQLNEQLNQKLEETAQALYKHWFVDFEFPISADQAASMGNAQLEGKPYKSSGGAMVYNEELDREIPEGWEVKTLDEFCECLDNLRRPLAAEHRKEMKGTYPYFGAMSIVDYINDFIYEGVYLLISEDGANVVDESGRPATQYVWGRFWLNNHAHIVQGRSPFTTEYLKVALCFVNAAHLVTGAAQPKINQKNLMTIKLLDSEKVILNKVNLLLKKVYNQIVNRTEQNWKLNLFRNILLSKMTRVEEGVVTQ